MLYCSILVCPLYHGRHSDAACYVGRGRNMTLPNVARRTGKLTYSVFSSFLQVYTYRLSRCRFLNYYGKDSHLEAIVNRYVPSRLSTNTMSKLNRSSQR